MNYEKKRLVADGYRIVTECGEYIATVSMTMEAKALLDNELWDKTAESWLDYRNRTAEDREKEEQKRMALVEDIVNAYNSTI